MDFSTVAKSVVVLSLAWLTTSLLRRASPALKHGVWFAATVVALLLPIFAMLGGLVSLRSWAPAQSADVLVFAPDLLATVPRDLAGLGLSRVLVSVWAGVALLLLGRLVQSHMRLRRFLTRAEVALDLQAGMSTPVLTHPAVTAPFTAGLWRRRILLPLSARSWPSPVLSAVLAHEAAHVARQDCLTQSIAQLARAVFWFNPLVWLAEARMRHLRELACDEAVLAGGTKPTDYATWLLSLRALPMPTFAEVAGVAESSGIAQRITLIVGLRKPLARRTAWLGATCFSVLTLIVACEQLEKPVTSPVANAPAQAVVNEVPASSPVQTTATGPMKEGSLDPALIKAAIQAHRTGIRDCYEKELRFDKTLSGSIKSHFIIQPNGSVEPSVIEESTMGNTKVENCIAQLIKTITFPKPKGAGIVIVNYPFLFRPAG